MEKFRKALFKLFRLKEAAPMSFFVKRYVSSSKILVKEIDEYVDTYDFTAFNHIKIHFVKNDVIQLNKYYIIFVFFFANIAMFLALFSSLNFATFIMPMLILTKIIYHPYFVFLIVSKNQKK